MKLEIGKDEYPVPRHDLEDGCVIDDMEKYGLFLPLIAVTPEHLLQVRERGEYKNKRAIPSVYTVLPGPILALYPAPDKAYNLVFRYAEWKEA